MPAGRWPQLLGGYRQMPNSLMNVQMPHEMAHASVSEIWWLSSNTKEVFSSQTHHT